ncbi:MAG TPA: SulP family inorganic anion transporter [Gemmatimonadaceae bacterium]|nr:SulP family inorganic anion transporter [Gemmatimonadaceae bacterium]
MPQPSPAPSVAPPFSSSWRSDLPASLVVVFVALPLCLGIALASGAPLTAGIVAGVIGGIVVGLLSTSQLMVSGPAAGLSAIVLAGITSLGSFQAFLAAVVIGGVLQTALGLLRAGVIGYYFPSTVIKGMLAAIGVILILKQIPHAVGYDADFVGDESFRQANDETTFTALGDLAQQVQPGAVVIALLSLTVLILWAQPAFRRLKVVPAPLIVVLLGIGLNALFARVWPEFAIRSTHLVSLPVTDRPSQWLTFFSMPDWSAITSFTTWRLGVTIAIVASLETLLSLEATDKMDPFKRQSDTNRELLAQGIGNTLAGLVGGLPVTGVIVRSAANIDAGAQTRWSAIIHGGLLLVFVLAIPTVLNMIPLAALAAMLLYTGFKLASPALFRTAWKLGWAQFIPFVVTVVAIVLTDLLVGIAIGLAIATFFILAQYLRQDALRLVSPPGAILRRYQLPDQATFLSKANIGQTLNALPDGSRVEIDGGSTTRFDYDVIEQLYEFVETARLRNIDYRLVNVPTALITPTHKH